MTKNDPSTSTHTSSSAQICGPQDGRAARVRSTAQRCAGTERCDGSGPTCRSGGDCCSSSEPGTDRGVSAAGRGVADRRQSNEGSTQSWGVVDRRLGLDRRQIESGGEAETANPDLNRRRGPGRRLSDFTKAAEEGEMTKEQFMFLVAIDEFKKANNKAYPTWTDILEVVRLLGYRKTMSSEIRLRRAEDWREEPMAPSNVRAPRWAEKAA